MGADDAIREETQREAEGRETPGGSPYADPAATASGDDGQGEPADDRSSS